VSEDQLDLAGIEPRAARLLEVMLRLLGGDLTARAHASDGQDSVDALAVGLNVLAETLEREHTARERAEALLRDAVETYDKAPDLFCSCELGTLSVVKCNRAFAELLTRSDAELLGTPLLDLVEPASRSVLRDTLERLARDGWVRATQIPLDLPAPVIVSLTGSVIRDASGAPVRLLLSLRDVTTERQLEDQLVHAQRMEAIGRLAGGVAHDFNNLLMVVLSSAELVAQKLGTGSPVAEELVMLREAGERASVLTRDLLAFSRRESGRPSAISVDATLERALPLLRRLVGDAVTLEVVAGAGEARIWFDPARLEQVVVNLLVNARDAMPRGGRVVVSTQRLERDAEYWARHPDVAVGEYVELCVADDGVGIPEGVLPRLFEPFFTTKPVGKGTGLGLSTVYGLVRQVGGFVRVESAPGAGARFFLLFPLHESAAARELAVSPEPGAEETILVVEDDDRVRRLTCRILREVGFRVIEAADGRAALETFEGEAPTLSLVVCDVVMPELSGPDVVQLMREKRPELPCLFVTGFSREHEASLARLGVPVLEKPFLPAALLASVRAALQRQTRCAQGLAP
jgi:signal transduction histidine kinase/ActR/RegA family two-component response regulator